MTISYRLKNGRVERQIVSSRNGPHLRGEDRPPGHFSQTLLKAYYDLECQQGSRFRCGWRKSYVKDVHDTAIARHEAGLT